MLEVVYAGVPGSSILELPGEKPKSCDCTEAESMTGTAA